MPGGPGDTVRRVLVGSGKRDFSSEFTATTPRAIAAAAAQGEATEEPEEAGAQDRHMPSIFHNATGDGKLTRVSEWCKFTPSEQEGLLELRRRLLSCESELASLTAFLADGNAAGLPHMRERHRSRLRGESYTIEEAQKEFCNERLLGRMQGYVSFIDSALAGTLDGLPWSTAERTATPKSGGPPTSQTPRLSSPCGDATLLPSHATLARLRTPVLRPLGA